jgi:predicted PurR-regulated permease PerM
VIDPPSRPSRLPEWIPRVGIASWSFLGFAGALAVIIFVMTTLRALVIPLVLAGFLAIVFQPLVDRLERRRVPRPLGALAVIALIAATIFATIAIVVIGIVDRADELSDAFDDAQAQLEDLAADWGLDDFLADLRSGDGGGAIREGLGRGIGTVLGSAAAFLSGLVLGVVLLYYLLKDGASMAGVITRRATPESSEQTERIVDQAADSIRGYVRGRTILAAVQGVSVTVALWLMDVPLAGSIGVVNFIGAFVPYLGAFIGGAFAVIMALAGGGAGLAVAALVVVLFVNVVLENLLEPRLLGSTLKMHPVAVLLSTVAGGVLIGMAGLVLAAPLVAIGTNLFKELRATNFFRDSPDPDAGPEPTLIVPD